MSDVLRQADPRWKDVLLGDGPGYLGGQGCLVTCVAQAARHMGTRPDILPPHVNEACRQAMAFKGNRLILPDALRLHGLTTNPAEWTNMKHTAADHRAALSRSLGGGVAVGCAVLHVDHDEHKAGGDPDGDHFVLAISLNAEHPAKIIVCDPATGKVEGIGWDDLQGVVKWGSVAKVYQIRGVRPVRLAST